MSQPLSTDELRARFLDFFVAHEHKLYSSVSLLPSHPAAPLFTNAGMVQFLPVFLGEEPAPAPRATSVQRCLRVRGKHDDIEVIGRTTRHLTFFEMLGNFSFGDYFKEGAIKYAWELLTEVLELDGDRMWATVHESDDEAAEMWRELIGMPAERIQRMGEDNFWEMGATGPCGPSSEVFYDKGPEFGADGGPSGGGEERFVEIWNLVFMAFNRLEDQSLTPLPRQNIDTGAGLERILPIVQGKDSVFDTDVLRGLIGQAEELTGRAYGSEEEDDVSLRIVADHSRAVTFMLADGVVPSNEERGYVLRRIIRRAVRHGQRLGAREGMLPAMAATVADAMGGAYPELRRSLDTIRDILEREEHRFLDTLNVGLGMLEEAIAGGAETVSGETAFKLHDTYGFPIDLTSEIASERGVGVDREGFEHEMEEQRARARNAESAQGTMSADEQDAQIDTAGLPATEFVGYTSLRERTKLLRLVPDADGETVEVFVASSPFYVEGGGQIADTGTITSAAGTGRVLATTRTPDRVVRHTVRMESGQLGEGEEVTLSVDRERREATQRAHTATHLLHWALRTVLGEQVRQQGSLVEPDALRFDFNHHSPLDKETIAEIEDLVTKEILGDGAVSTSERSLAQAREAGAMSFFGEKYGEIVRVVQAGEHSMELCGGTHVSALGRIGSFVVRSESSVGANLRRIEALTGLAAHGDHRHARELVHTAAELLHVAPASLTDAIARLQSTLGQQERERRALVAQIDRDVAGELAGSAEGGVLAVRLDGRDQGALREIAAELIQRADISAVGLIGSPDGESVAIAVASVSPERDAPSIVRATAKLVGGGGGGSNPKLAVGGGREVSGIDAALQALRDSLSSSPVG